MSVAVGGHRRAVEDGQGLHHQAASLIEPSFRGKLFGLVIGDP